MQQSKESPFPFSLCYYLLISLKFYLHGLCYLVIKVDCYSIGVVLGRGTLSHSGSIDVPNLA